jgi:hypothetical protein
MFMDQGSSPCDTAEAHQFDFWLGEWDITWGMTGKGKNSVRKILGGCAIEETFDGTETIPLIGRSLTVFSAQFARWNQTWVDNQGSYLMFIGEWDEDDQRMVLERDDLIAGKHIKQRMVWHHITPVSLDWSWEKSEDGGITWAAEWEIHYQRTG